MASYIDGFVFPIARKHLGSYLALAERVAEIWQEHGALAYREWIGDDLSFEGTRSFSELVEPDSDEVTLFGWVEFASRAARDVAHEKVKNDARMADLMASFGAGFESKRMVFGGFSEPPGS